MSVLREHFERAGMTLCHVLGIASAVEVMASFLPRIRGLCTLAYDWGMQGRLYALCGAGVHTYGTPDGIVPWWSRDLGVPSSGGGAPAPRPKSSLLPRADDTIRAHDPPVRFRGSLAIVALQLDSVTVRLASLHEGVVVTCKKCPPQRLHGACQLPA